jgi:hypothetical protein
MLKEQEAFVQIALITGYGQIAALQGARSVIVHYLTSNELSKSSAVHGYRWRLQLCSEFHSVPMLFRGLAQVGVFLYA